jgi:hypothetical protein
MAAEISGEEWFSRRSRDSAAVGHVPFDFNRVSPLVIAGLDPAIRAEKTLRRPCRNGFDCAKSA